MNRLISTRPCWISKSMTFPPPPYLHSPYDTNQNSPRLRRELSQATRRSSRPNSPPRLKNDTNLPPRASGQIDDVEEGPEQAEVSNVHGFDLGEYLQRSNQEAYNSGIISKKIGLSLWPLSVSGTGSGYAVVSTFFDEFLALFGKSILERGWGYGRRGLQVYYY